MSNNPFIKQISEETQKEINELIEYYKKLSNEEELSSEEKTRFNNMTAGAEVVLNILRNSGLGTEGTRNWLSKLTESQLEYAKDCIDELLKKKNEERMVTLWTVYTEYSCTYCFEEEDFIKASQKAQQLLIEDEKTYPNRQNELVLKKIKVKESEVKEYLDNVD